MLKELREKRTKLIKDARAILDAATTEKRATTDEESKRYDTLFNEAQSLGEQITREQRQREAERELMETLETEDEKRGGDAGENAANRDGVLDCFRSYIMEGKTGVANHEARDEFRALAAGVNTQGGYIVAPEIFVQQLIKALDDDVVVRSLATVYPLENSSGIGAPSLDNDLDDGDWTEELQTGSEDSGMAFGKRVMEPHPVAKRIKVSRQLMRISALPVEAIVAQRFAYKFGVTQEKAYMTGNGNKRPLGLFTASNDGIPTGRDVSQDNTTLTPTMDGLKRAKYSLKPGYWRNSNWIFHRDITLLISKLKDGDGQYIWNESTTEDDPDRLLGRPAYMSEFAPNTIQASAYVGIVGDFSYYWILDSMMMQMQRLDELYAETNQTGFIGRYEGDGAPVLGEAFSRVQLAAS